jgi:hypothetical protein
MCGYIIFKAACIYVNVFKSKALWSEQIKTIIYTFANGTYNPGMINQTEVKINKNSLYCVRNSVPGYNYYTANNACNGR